jgi:hypothetical protein
MDRFEITLRFEDADQMLQALDHIGDEDAPVFLADGSFAQLGRTTYPLWEGGPDLRLALITNTNNQTGE